VPDKEVCQILPAFRRNFAVRRFNHERRP
jgi:hypothetical protein